MLPPISTAVTKNLNRSPFLAGCVLSPSAMSLCGDGVEDSMPELCPVKIDMNEKVAATVRTQMSDGGRCVSHICSAHRAGGRGVRPAAWTP